MKTEILDLGIILKCDITYDIHHVSSDFCDCCDKSCDNKPKKWLKQPLFSVFNLFYESRGQGFESLPAHHKSQYLLGVGFFVCYDEGREPERVAACKKQCGTLFLAARALLPEQGQAVFAAGKDSESFPAHQRTDIQKMSVF